MKYWQGEDETTRAPSTNVHLLPAFHYCCSKSSRSCLSVTLKDLYRQAGVFTLELSIVSVKFSECPTTTEALSIILSSNKSFLLEF